MEQHLSVRPCAEAFLARPWLPPRAFGVFGAAPFRSGLALRARTNGKPKDPMVFKPPQVRHSLRVTGSVMLHTARFLLN
jgi:hypothetical protein